MSCKHTFYHGDKNTKQPVDYCVKCKRLKMSIIEEQLADMVYESRQLPEVEDKVYNLLVEPVNYRRLKKKYEV